MPLIIPANSLTGGYEIDNSLRFNSGSSDYLSRTPASAGNRQIWTYSGWIKRGKLSVNTRQCLLSAGNNNGTDTGAILIGFTDADAFTVETYQAKILTTQVFRDISAWYHIVVAVDTTQTGITNQCKLYVNGSQVTQFSTTNAFSASVNTPFNNTISHRIGQQANAPTRFFDGYQSEINWIDGQALDPTDFGEFDEDSGIWKPIAYTGTYGTNGFYLDFENSGSLGADVSGNGNNFTVNNLTSIDQTTDTPTNNFATWNSLIKTAATFSNGNTSLNNTSTPYKGSMATIVPTQGKWYAEIKVTDAAYLQIGFITADTLLDGDRSIYASSSNIYWQDNNSVIYYYLNGSFQGAATVTGGTNSVSTYTTNDIIMLAMDLDNGYGWFGKNGTWENSGNPASGTNAFNLASDYANGTTIYTGCLNANVAANFGNAPYTIASGNSDANGYGNFEYAVPSGYYALCTKNLAEYG